MRTFTQKWAFLLVALLCCVGLPMQADDLTVNDGTTTNEYVPIYGYYGDTSGKSQFVVPSADLSAIAGGSISGLSFYANADFNFCGHKDNSRINDDYRRQIWISHHPVYDSQGASES